MKNMYCEFENTNTQFNGRDIYKCKYCDIKLLLEDPDNARVMCFAKREAINRSLDPNYDDSEVMPGLTEDNFKEHAINQIIQKHAVAEGTPEELIEKTKNRIHDHDMCSKEQIEERMSICEKCEFYENNSCLMCGCVVVRDKKYQNKLAKKSQVCPVGKWGQIKD